MTGITVDRESPSVETSSAVQKFIAIVLMIAGLMGSISLLNWAVKDKLSKTEVTEPSEITAALRDHQLGCLAKNIYHEAGNEPFEGKAAVAQVVLNRAKNSDFPDDVCKVIYQKNVVYEKVICQFSWFCDRAVISRNVNEKSYDESMEVAKKVLLEGFELPSIKGALYYHADYINPGWGKKPIAHIGHHIFYK